MVTEIQIDHEGEYVTISGPEGGRLAKLDPEKAIKAAHELLDASEKALRGTKQLQEYD